MAVDVHLWQVPGDANQNDVRLRDPAATSGPAAAFVMAQVVDDE